MISASREKISKYLECLCFYQCLTLRWFLRELIKAARITEEKPVGDLSFRLQNIVIVFVQGFMILNPNLVSSD